MTKAKTIYSITLSITSSIGVFVLANTFMVSAVIAACISGVVLVAMLGIASANINK